MYGRYEESQMNRIDHRTISIMGVLFIMNLRIAPVLAQTKTSLPPFKNPNTYHCALVEDPTKTGKTMWATVAKFSNTEDYVIVVNWKEENFNKSDRLTDEERCNKYTEEFQTRLTNQPFRFLIIGRIKESNPYRSGLFVCAVLSENSPCTNQNILFEVKDTDHPNKRLKALTSYKKGEGSAPIFQGSNWWDSLLPWDLFKKRSRAIVKSWGSK
jgi:hypothetical protein